MPVGGMCIIRTIRRLVIMAFVFLVLPVVVIIFALFLIMLHIYWMVEMDCADMICSPTFALEGYWAVQVGAVKLVHHDIHLVKSIQ